MEENKVEYNGMGETKVEEKKKREGRGGSITSILIALIAGVSAIICFTIITNGLVGYKEADKGGGLTATGSASCDFESDLIVWDGSFYAYEQDSAMAYSTIKRDAEKVRQYLLDNGVTEDEMVFSSVDSRTVYSYEYDEFGNEIREYEDGVEMSQSLRVTSNDIDKVEKVSRDITTLLESGVEFSSYSPNYYCTALDEVKLELIEKATENAKQRIEIIAEQTGCKPGELLTANLGVFQITAKNSGTGEYTYDGAFDTYSRDKTATITVRLNYSVE